MPLVLTRQDVMSVLGMPECMDAVEKAFAELALGSAVLPLRTTIPLPDGLSLYMPAYLKTANALSCKVVTAFKNNPARHRLPTVIGTVFLQDPQTGEVTCIMDGTYLTAVRTGAASGVATKYCARDGRGLAAGILGAGEQGRMQLWGVATARALSCAFVYDCSPEAMRSFAAEMGPKLSLDIRTCGSPEELVDNCDILCTATTATTPLFDGTRVKAGAHVNGIGSHTPDARELDTALIKRSIVVADSYEACLKEAGDIIIPIREGAVDASVLHAELGEIIIGRKTARRNDTDITVFKSNGLAVQDAATAQRVFAKAKQNNIGTFIRL